MLLAYEDVGILMDVNIVVIKIEDLYYVYLKKEYQYVVVSKFLYD